MGGVEVAIELRPLPTGQRLDAATSERFGEALVAHVLAMPLPYAEMAERAEREARARRWAGGPLSWSTT